MAVAAADFRLGDGCAAEVTVGANLDPPAQADHAGVEHRLELEMRAGVGEEETRDGTQAAVGGLPAGAGMAAEQAALLSVVAPVEIGVVVRALLASRCAHIGGDLGIRRG